MIATASSEAVSVSMRKLRMGLYEFLARFRRRVWVVFKHARAQRIGPWSDR